MRVQTRLQFSENYSTRNSWLSEWLISFLTSDGQKTEGANNGGEEN